MEKENFVRPVLRAAKEAGLSKEERRKLMQRGDDMVNDVIDFSHEDLDWKPSVEGTTDFFRFTEGTLDATSRNEALHSMASVLRQYGSKVGRNERIELGYEERRLVSLAVKYFEDWMYRGVFFEEPKGRASEFLGGSAFIVNQLAKVKEVANRGVPADSEALVASFDSERLGRLIDETLAFAEGYMSKEQIDARETRQKAKYEATSAQYAELERKKKPFDQEIDKHVQEVRGEYEQFRARMEERTIDKSEQVVGGEDERALGAFFQEVLRPIEAEEYLIPTQFHPGRSLTSELVSDILWFKARDSVTDLLRRRLERLLRSEGQRRTDEDERVGSRPLPTLQIFDFHTRKLSALLKQKELVASNKSPQVAPRVQKASGLAALGSLRGAIATVDFSLKDLKILFDPLYFSEKKEQVRIIKGRRNDAVDLEELSRLTYQRDEEKRRYEYMRLQDWNKSRVALAASAESARRQLPGSLSGDLYFLKTLLIAAAEQQNNDVRYRQHFFSPDSFVPNVAKHDAVYDFQFSQRNLGRENYSSGGYMSVHFDPAHLPLAQFVVEYMRSKREKKKMPVSKESLEREE